MESTLPCSDENADISWEVKLLQADYEFVFFDGLSRYYLSNQKLELRKHFAYPAGIHDSFITKKFQDINELNQNLYLNNRILDQKILDMRSSLCWKITKPLRILHNIALKGLGKPYFKE